MANRESALDTQVGGRHYTMMKMQPFELITEIHADYYLGNVIKYLSRYKRKNGRQDLEKARHYIQYMRENNVRQYLAPDWESEIRHYCKLNEMEVEEFILLHVAVGRFDHALMRVEVLINNYNGGKK